MAIATMLASMADWWTPTVLFCVLNLMIITIFIASNFKSPNNHHHHDNMPSQLTRSPSLLERVKSVNLSSFYTTQESDHQYKVHSETTEHDSVSQLSRPPSLLQRVKSIEFSFSYFHNSFPTESEQLGNSPTKGARSLSLLDRVKSFKLSAPFNSDQHSGDTSSSKDEQSDLDPHHDSVEDDNITSVSEKSCATLVNESPGKLIESGSVKKVVTSNRGEENNIWRRPATKKSAARVHDESVDTKADDFIKRFKQQLKLQRLDSLQRLREMLNRGTSSS